MKYKKKWKMKMEIGMQNTDTDFLLLTENFCWWRTEHTTKMTNILVQQCYGMSNNMMLKWRKKCKPQHHCALTYSIPRHCHCGLPAAQWIFTCTVYNSSSKGNSSKLTTSYVKLKNPNNCYSTNKRNAKQNCTQHKLVI